MPTTILDKLKGYLIDKATLEKIERLEEKHIEFFESRARSVQESVFKEILGEFLPSTQCSLGSNVIHDIELIQSYGAATPHDDPQLCTHPDVLSSILHNKLQGSKYYLSRLLTQPVYDLEKLTGRQEVLKKYIEIMSDPSQFKELEGAFDAMADCEQDMIWLFQEKDMDDLTTLYDLAFFSNWMTRPLNTRPLLLTSYNIYRIVLSPIIGLLTPLSYIIIPFLVLKLKFKLNMSFMSYVRFTLKAMLSGSGMIFGNNKLDSLKYISLAFTITFYFTSMFNTCEISRSCYKICNIVTKRIKSILIYIKQAHLVIDKYWLADDMTPFTESCLVLDKTGTDYFTNIDIKDLMSTKNILLQNFGTYLKVFKFIKKENYIALLKISYWLDAVCNIALVASRKTKSFSLVSFVPRDQDGEQTSILVCKDFIHPCLDNDAAVKNSIVLSRGGEESAHPCAIITGPNAGGKSTTLKSVMIAVMFAQSFTIAPAMSMKLTPFYYIGSQINIPDCKGKESLFEAEMNRCKSTLDMVENLHTDSSHDKSRNAFIIMDEIFNSTNPVEGIAGAYAILQKLSSYPNVLAMITTHYLYLTKLCKSDSKAFKALKMNVNISPDDQSISYPYKLVPGVSKQYIALELLRINGFDTDIIESALQVKADILKPRE